MAVTEFLSLSWITIGSESYLNVEQVMRALHMWCDAPESMTHFGGASAAAARAQAVSNKGSLSPVVARAAVAVAFFTLHHSFIRL